MIRTAAVSLLLVAGTALADQVTIGTTYPIAERDALSEIEVRVAGVDWGSVLDPDNVKWSATEGHRLPRDLGIGDPAPHRHGHSHRRRFSRGFGIVEPRDVHSRRQDQTSLGRGGSSLNRDAGTQ